MEKEHYQERLLAIVLLALIGSTDFVRRVGAMKAAEWLQYHDRLSRSMLYKFNGREIDRSDGFLLSFERPIDALNFALNYQKTIPAKTHLNARIGIHWGQKVLDMLVLVSISLRVSDNHKPSMRWVSPSNHYNHLRVMRKLRG